MKKIILILITLVSVSCSNNNEEIIDYGPINETQIEEYVAQNDLTAFKTDSGLYYIIHNEGGGDYPSPNSEVTVSYKGYFLNSTVFDQSNEATFPLNQLIPGFSEATQKIKVGGEITALIPSKLAYGDKGHGQIPGGSVVVFDIKLISIN